MLVRVWFWYLLALFLKAVSPSLFLSVDLIAWPCAITACVLTRNTKYGSKKKAAHYWNNYLLKYGKIAFAQWERLTSLTIPQLLLVLLPLSSLQNAVVSWDRHNRGLSNGLVRFSLLEKEAAIGHWNTTVCDGASCTEISLGCRVNRGKFVLCLNEKSCLEWLCSSLYFFRFFIHLIFSWIMFTLAVHLKVQLSSWAEVHFEATTQHYTETRLFFLHAFLCE